MKLSYCGCVGNLKSDQVWWQWSNQMMMMMMMMMKMMMMMNSSQRRLMVLWLWLTWHRLVVVEDGWPFPAVALPNHQLSQIFNQKTKV
jgi:carbon starvation protein CstA